MSNIKEIVYNPEKTQSKRKFTKYQCAYGVEPIAHHKKGRVIRAYHQCENSPVVEVGGYKFCRQHAKALGADNGKET